MKQRILSGAFIVAIVTIIMYFGGIVFDFAIGLLAVCSFYELTKIKKRVSIPNIMKIIGLICMLLLIYINTEGHTFLFGLSFEVLSLVFLLILVPTLFYNSSKYSVADAFYLGAITIFLGTVFNLFIGIYNESPKLFLLVIIIAFATDTFALLGGKLIGKHHFTEISPNKTIEGCVCGSIIATIIATTYYAAFINDTNLVEMVFIIIILSIVGQMGDLFFSLIKRENNVKDYSHLIPGHGGILDRIDSIIFIVMAIVFLIQFI